jgi:LPS-assembly protein
MLALIDANHAPRGHEVVKMLCWRQWILGANAGIRLGMPIRRSRAPGTISGLFLTGLVAISAIAPVRAGTDMCAFPPPEFWPQRLMLAPDAYRIESTVVTGRLGESLLARGDVSLFREGLRINSTELQFDVAANRLEAPGRSVFFDGAILLAGNDLELDLDSGRGQLVDVEFWVSPPWMRSTFEPLASLEELGVPATTYREAPTTPGELLQLEQPLPGRGAAIVAQHEGTRRVRLENARYTTCPEDAESWRITARSLELDAQSGRGKARNVTLRAGNLPVFFTPYLDFPIDDRRKTGFLYPSVRQSSRTGWGFTAPYYWNLAPNRDLTFTPRFESRRGVLWDTETRYLYASSQGQLDAAYLSGDRLYGDDRHSVRWRHTSALRPDLILDIDAGNVSDVQYFEDFATTFTDRTSRTVERRVNLRYAPRTPLAGATWQLSGGVQSFQILEEGVDPYRRVPQIRLDGRSLAASPLTWTARSEIVHFDRRRGPTGNRLHTDLQLQNRVEDWGYFLEPGLRLRHTRYDLEGTPQGAGSITRTIASGQIDAGLILTRALGSEHTQTLEPRLFYGYVPFVDQNDIPLFDTAEQAFGLNQLFTLDRFSGSDRIGDTHQITTALTTRFIADTTGAEILSLSGGEVYYLSDRRVRGSPQQMPLSNGSSGPFLAGRLNLGTHWDLETNVFFNPSRLTRNEQSAGLYYRQDRRQMNLGYRFLENQTEQFDFAVHSPLGARAALIGRLNYDLDARQPLDVVAGLEYRSCCYVVRGAFTRQRIGAENLYDNAILLQLTLTGFGRFDTGLQDRLRDVIPGYE